MLIAIDGPAASGKGTVAKQIAAHFGMEYLDTGRLYRLVGHTMLKAGFSTDKHSEKSFVDKAESISQNLDLSLIQSEDLETEEVGKWASIVSAIPEVRGALIELQRNVSKSPKGAVLDGRDIGTIICPNANFKFFITAEPDVRAERRYKQLKLRKKDVEKAVILKDIIARDERDSNRDVAPLVPAMDAIYIDTTDMSVEEVFEKVRSTIEVESSC